MKFTNYAATSILFVSAIRASLPDDNDNDKQNTSKSIENLTDEFSDVTLDTSTSINLEKYQEMMEFLRNGAHSGDSSSYSRLAPISVKPKIVDPRLNELTTALQNDRIETAISLIESDIDVNFVDDNGYSPLCYASEKGNAEIVQLLIKKKADVNAKDCRITPLILAIKNNHPETVETLLRFGANVDTADSLKCTPLIHASLKGFVGIVQLLLQYDPDVNSCDLANRTALAYASKNEFITELLVERGGVYES